MERTEKDKQEIYDSYPIEIRKLFDKQAQGYKLDEEEIMKMMYALELLKEFGRLTEESIARFEHKLEEIPQLNEEY